MNSQESTPVVPAAKSASILWFFAGAGVLVLALTAVRMYWPAQASDVEREASSLLRTYKPAPLDGDLSGLLRDPKSYYVPTMEHSLLGRKAPGFHLTDWRGRALDLGDLLKDGPVVLIFYYGYWCDHCVVQLFDISEEIERFKRLGTRVVAMSADSPDETAAKFEQYGAFEFDVLSDPESRVARTYGCYEPAKDGQEAKLFHGTFVIDTDGTIRWMDVSDQPFRSIKTLLLELARLRGELPADVDVPGQPERTRSESTP